MSPQPPQILSFQQLRLRGQARRPRTDEQLRLATVRFGDGQSIDE